MASSLRRAKVLASRADSLGVDGECYIPGNREFRRVDFCERIDFRVYGCLGCFMMGYVPRALFKTGLTMREGFQKLSD